MLSLPNMPSISSFFGRNMPEISMSSVLFTGLAMLVGTLLKEVLAISIKFLPQKLYETMESKLESLVGNYFSQMTLIIEEHIHGHSINEMFEASEVYLPSIISHSTERLKVSKTSDDDLCFSIDQGEKIVDVFRGVQLTWEMICTETENEKRRSIELKFHKKHKEMVQRTYLPHVLQTSKTMKEENKVRKLHSSRDEWINFNHTSTFDTVAMDPKLKTELIDDLDRFVTRREYYQRIRKAWKRGYLLYGPPGTGKSSLIAAMANHLKFHIYDLELTSIQSNSDLRSLLLSTANQSILVIEDIDCSSNLQRQIDGENNYPNHQLTLSGLLNFIDGLWSCSCDGRIIIVTTNHKDKLDPALLRPGRMDMHIHMSYCTPCGFKVLASNYLGINNHSMFTEIEKLLKEVEVTPAEIAEELLKSKVTPAEIAEKLLKSEVTPPTEIAKELLKSEVADKTLGGLIKFLHKKKTEHDKANAEGEKEVTDQVKESPGNKKSRKNKRKVNKGRSKR